MLPLETKQFGGKLLPHSDLRGECLQRKYHAAAKEIRWIFRKLEGVVGTGWSWLRIWTVGGHLRVR